MKVTPVATTSGTGTPTTLLVSTVTNVALTEFASTSLFTSDPVTVTGSGHTVAFFCRAASTDDSSVVINVLVDGVTLISGSSGDPLNAPMVLSAGSHTIAFQAFALDTGITVNVATMFLIDLGL